VRLKTIQHGDAPVTSGFRVVLGVAVAAIVSMTAISPTCAAQTAAVIVPAPLNSIATGSIPGAENAISRVTTAADTLHMVVGHSIFLNTKARLRRVYVADPAILNSITLSPNQILVTAMLPGISSLILFDEAGQAQSYVVSSDVDVQGLRAELADTMHDNSVSVQGSGSRVILSGRVTSDALSDSAVKLATLYSKDVSNSLTVEPEHPKQVRLKVRILEVDRSKLLQLGINLFNPGGNSSYIASTTTSQFPSQSTLSTSSTTGGSLITTSNPLNFLLYSSKLNLGANIQDLESKNVLQILAEPTITTISGQKADFLSGGEFPFPVIQPGSGSGTSSSVTIQFKPYGVKLEFTPVVNPDGTIRLKVAPEVSALDYTNAVSISGYTVPALSTRKADTEVELRSDQSFAISGLLDQRTTDLMSKTPGIASIPIIGNLFKSKNSNHSTTELIVVITPTLVDPIGNTGEPKEPSLPIPTLNEQKYDKSLGRDRNPNPIAPPLNPSPAVNQSTPTQSVPAPGAAQEVPQQSEPAAAPAPAVYPPATASTTEPNSQVPQRYVFDNPVANLVADSAVPDSAPTQGEAMVQIVALSHKEDADAMVTALKRHGYDVSVTQSPRDSLLHLEVGPFKDKSEAEAMRQRLLTDGYNATVKNESPGL
jgi:pilus assembly protein CpaC